jgi:hypothetical protein
VYTGPAGGVQWQYLYTGSDNLDVTANTNNWFIYTGTGEDAIAVSGGTNVLDGNGSSNFMTGGTGTDTFFVNDQNPAGASWSTVNNFHAGDAATLFGITPGNSTLTWVDGQGAPGYTGLTLDVTTANQPTVSLTLVGYTTADLTDGRLTVEFGTEANGVPYMYVLGASNTASAAGGSAFSSTGSTPNSVLDLSQSGQLASAAGYGQVNVYGANDMITAIGDSTINLLGANTTIVGGTATYNDTVVGFSEGSDHLSFVGESAGSEAQIIAGAQVVNGNTILSFPDHSSIVLVGVTHADAGIFA